MPQQMIDAEQRQRLLAKYGDLSASRLVTARVSGTATFVQEMAMAKIERPPSAPRKQEAVEYIPRREAEVRHSLPEHAHICAELLADACHTASPRPNCCS